jgi:hypothetical protein
LHYSPTNLFFAFQEQEGQTSHKSHSETILSQNPSGNSQRTEEISTEIGRLKTTGHTRRDVEGRLEVGVESVEETICETPEEEEDRHYTNRLVLQVAGKLVVGTHRVGSAPKTVAA